MVDGYTHQSRARQWRRDKGTNDRRGVSRPLICSHTFLALLKLRYNEAKKVRWRVMKQHGESAFLQTTKASTNTKITQYTYLHISLRQRTQHRSFYATANTFHDDVNDTFKVFFLSVRPTGSRRESVREKGRLCSVSPAVPRRQRRCSTRANHIHHVIAQYRNPRNIYQP